MRLEHVKSFPFNRFSPRCLENFGNKSSLFSSFKSQIYKLQGFHPLKVIKGTFLLYNKALISSSNG